jgi:tetratricopeptide (TPR) repeat protein
VGRKSSQKKQKKEKKGHAAIDKRGQLSPQAHLEGSGKKHIDRKWYWVLAVVLALSVLSYANSLQNEFVFDDSLVIVENPGIRGIEKLPRLLGITTGRLAYRPMRMLSYALDYTLNEKLWSYISNYQGMEKGLNPLGFHISNIAFHVITSFLVFMVVFGLAGSGRVAFFASAIFALHPVHTDSVTYLSGRRDILCALFYLLGFYCFLRYRQSNKVFLIVAAFAFYVLSLGSKEMGVTLPALFFAYDVMQQYSGQRGTINRAFFKELFKSAQKAITTSPYVYATLFSGALAFSYYKIAVKSPSYQTTFYGDSLYVTFLTVGRILAHYMHLLLYPVNLNADYSLNAFPLSSSIFEPSSFLSLLLLMGIAYLCLWLWGRNKLMAFGIIWFFVALLPVCHIFPHHELLAEHYLYLPSVGFCLVTALLFNSAFKKGKYSVPIAICLMVIMLLFSVRVVDRNRDWRDRLTFWEKTLKTAPECARVHVNLSEVYANTGRLDDALSAAQKALSINPDHIEGRNNLGTIYERKGMFDEAITEFKRALALRPRYAKAHLNLGLSYFRTGEKEKAISHYKQALSIKPNYVEAHNNLGVVYSSKGNLAEAINHYKRAQTINPSYAEAYYNLGLAFAKQEEWEKAIEQYKKVLAIDPQNTSARNNLGIAYMNKGTLDETIAEFQEILATSPDNLEIRFNLGIAYAKKGELRKAVEEYKRARAMGLETPELHANLGNVYFQQNRLDDAINEYKQALTIRDNFAIVHNNLALTYLKKGEYELAIKHCDRASELGEVHPKLLKDLLPYRGK